LGEVGILTLAKKRTVNAPPLSRFLRQGGHCDFHNNQM
jgi:hypothetical protein